MEPLYQRHIDITSGGRLIPRIGLPQAFEYYFKAVAIGNRFGLTDDNPNLSNQLKIQHLAYWTGRVIDSPTAIIITLFPGIWTDIFFKPNFFPNARQWIEGLTMSMYLQKCSVLGVRISKVPPYIVTPWSGYLYKTLDGGLSLGTIVGSILNQFNLTIDLFSAIIYQGDTSVLGPLKGIYANAINSVLTPQIFDLANSIPSIYGTDFNGIDLSVGANNQPIDNVILNSFESICKGFIAKYGNAAQGGGGFSASGRPIPNLTILVGVLGLEKEKEEWVSKNREGVTVIKYDDIRYPLAKEYYEKERAGYRGPYRIRYPYDDEYAQYEFFLGEDLVYSYTSRRYGIGISFSDYIRKRDPLFDITRKRAEDLIFDLLIQGTPVVFDARNLEREDRNRLQESLKRRIESIIQSEFLDEFDLRIDGSRSYNRGQWTNEQNEEYNKRIRELKGVTFSMKIFDYQDLIPKDTNFYSLTELKESTVLDQSIIEYISNKEGIYFAIEQEYPTSQDYRASLEEVSNKNRKEYLKELVYQKILENYDTEYVKERQSFDSDRIRLIETIVETQIRRFEDDRRARGTVDLNYRSLDNYSIITL
jgi:hypothetical protein